MTVNAQFAINAYTQTAQIGADLTGTPKPSALNDTGNFAGLIEGVINGVAEKGQKAEMAAIDVAKGKGDLVDLVTTIAETEIAVESLVTVRDRVITAYRDIMNMPI